MIKEKKKSETGLIVAIDGPAGSGKSTTAKLVAEKLGYLYIDTGAMYRAVTYKVLKNGLDISDTDSIVKLVEQINIKMQDKDGTLQVYVDNEDVTNEIRTPDVTKNVSAVSAIDGVRKKLVSIQQEIGKNGNVVLDGRDIGTVVFPNADVKIFLVADIEERAERRAKDLIKKGIHCSVNELIEDIRIRDEKDSTRSNSPLKKADEAITIDTTNLTIEEQVNKVIDEIKKVRSGLNSEPSKSLLL